MLLRFTNLEEFLAELALEQERIDRSILRLTIHRKFEGTLCAYTVVATALLPNRIVLRLERFLGTCFAASENENKALGDQADALIGRLKKEAEALSLHVRSGVYE